MLNHTFTWNGHSSDEFGIKVERFRPLNRSARKYDAASVPGRNGNLYGLQKAWDEVLVSYEIFAKEKHVADHNELYEINKTILNVTVSTDALGIYTINGSVSPLTSVTVFEGYTNEATYTIKGAPNASTATGAYLHFQLINMDTYQLVENGDIDTTDRVISCHRNYYLKVQLYMNAGTYNNVRVPFALYDDSYTSLDKTWTDIMEWLNSADGYAELSDTYDTEHYREAVFVDATDIANSWNEFGRAIVSFRCRPERYLNIGQNRQMDFSDTMQIGYILSWSLNIRASAPSGAIIAIVHEGDIVKILGSTTVSSIVWYNVELADGTTGWCQSQYDQTQYVAAYNVITITNPTKRTAKPKITLTTNGNLQLMINGQLLKVTHDAYPLYIDCENEDITGCLAADTVPISFNKWASVEDLNGNVSADFLTLQAGENYISIDGSATVTDCTFEMRFWEL